MTVFEDERRRLEAEANRWRATVERLVSAWNRGWDCSRDPGHAEVDRAMGDAELALSDAVFASKPELPRCGYCGDRPSSLVSCPVCDS